MNLKIHISKDNRKMQASGILNVLIFLKRSKRLNSFYITLTGKPGKLQNGRIPFLTVIPLCLLNFISHPGFSPNQRKNIAYVPCILKNSVFFCVLIKTGVLTEVIKVHLPCIPLDFYFLFSIPFILLPCLFIFSSWPDSKLTEVNWVTSMVSVNSRTGPFRKC